MKTQKSHKERQIQHSKELAQHRLKVEEARTIKKYKLVGWGFIGIWLLWVGIAYIMS